MKKILAFLLFVLLFACSDKKEIEPTLKVDNSIINDKLSAPPIADTFFIRYHFSKGDIFKYKITTLSSNSQELVTDSLVKTKSNQEVNYRVKLLVEDVDTSNVARITILIESIKVTGNINGKEVAYDSKFILSTRERIMFAQYEAIKKKKFTIDITEYGEILKIYNTKSIISELLSIQQKGNNISEQKRRELINNFSSTALRPLSEQIFRKFPSEKVSKNYSWSESYYSQFALFKIENIANFQVIDILTNNYDSIVVFNAGLSINFIGEHKATEQGMNFYFYDPVVSGSGVIKFNKSKGLILYSKTSANMEMETDITGIDQDKIPFKAKRTDNTSNTNIIEFVK